MFYFLKKLRKTPGDILILHLCIKNLDDITNSPGDSRLPKNPKNQNLEKIKQTCWISFYTCVPKPQSQS